MTEHKHGEMRLSKLYYKGKWVLRTTETGIEVNGKVDIKADVTEGVKPGVLSTTFHFPEIMVNNITSDEHDSEAYCPEYKVVSVSIRKARKTGFRKEGEFEGIGN